MENTNLYSTLESLIEYIEDNIEKKLSLENLSEVSCISKFYLIRIFKNITLMTIMDYVRSRKLARSLNDLLNTDMRIIDISTKYNFGFEQTYIRSFKKEYGITPSKFRKQHTPVKIVDKINLDFCTSFKNGILFNPHIVVKPEFKVIGIKDIIRKEENFTKNKANNNGVNFYFNHRHKIKNAINPNVYIGLTRLVNKDVDYTYYMPSIQVSNFNFIPNNMTCDTIPASKYAVFHYIGNHPVEKISMFTMESLYDYIYNHWMTLHNYDSIAEGPFHFEEIDANNASENYCEAKIYFPLKL